MGDILVAIESFSASLKGTEYTVNAGTTRVDSKHILAKTYPDWFKPVDVRFGKVETATAAPGEERKQTRRKK